MNLRYSIHKMQEEQTFVQNMFQRLELYASENPRGLPTKRFKESERPVDWQEQFEITFRTLKSASSANRAKFSQDLRELNRRG